jgi:hypothetical protein
VVSPRAREEIVRPQNHSGASVRPLKFTVRRAMTSWTPSAVPYEIHTGRELEFMLSRGKPLAHFSEVYPPEPVEEIIPRRAFAPYVSNGTFETCVFVRLLNCLPPQRAPHVRGTLHVFYALPHETWRIEDFIALMNAADSQGWSENFERREGLLLGYSTEENDAHIEHQLRSPHASDFPWLKRLIAERERPGGTSNNAWSGRDT